MFGYTPGNGPPDQATSNNVHDLLINAEDAEDPALYLAFDESRGLSPLPSVDVECVSC